MVCLLHAAVRVESRTLAVGSSPDDAVFVVAYSGSTLPPKIQKLIDRT
ncbi:hypothetical protein AB0407_21555 [Streptomyces microflavus]